MTKGDLIEKFQKRLNVPEIQIHDALEYFKKNPILPKFLDMLFEEAIATERNTLETVKPEELLRVQGRIQGLVTARGIVKGQVES